MSCDWLRSSEQSSRPRTSQPVKKSLPRPVTAGSSTACEDFESILRPRHEGTDSVIDILIFCLRNDTIRQLHVAVCEDLLGGPKGLLRTWRTFASLVALEASFAARSGSH